jgi:hypothetical protein
MLKEYSECTTYVIAPFLDTEYLNKQLTNKHIRQFLVYHLKHMIEVV